MQAGARFGVYDAAARRGRRGRRRTSRTGRRARRRRLRAHHAASPAARSSRRPRHHWRRHRGRQRLPRGVAHAARSAARALSAGAQDGVRAGPPARRHDEPDHQVRGDRAGHGARGGHGVDGLPRVLPRRPRALLPGDPARRAGRQGARGQGCGCLEDGRLPRLDPLARRPGGGRAAGRPCSCTRRSGHPARQPGVDHPGHRGRRRTRPHAQRPRLHERRGARHAAARGPAPLPAVAPVRLLQRRRHRDRRHAVRLPDGLRQAALPRGDGRADRPRLPHGRQEPRHRPRHRRGRGAGAEGGHRGGLRAGQRRGVQRKEWLDELRAAEHTALEKRLPQLRSDASPIHP
ncbi:hypothetical protein STENM223S_08258 [Streptomyces tendae]